MSKSKKAWFLTGALLAVAVLSGSLCYLMTGSHTFSASHVILFDVFFLLVMAIAAMILSLRHSLSTAFYSYKNIGLYGGILFASVLAAALIFKFLSRLSHGIPDAKNIYNSLLAFPREFSYYALFVIVGVSILVGISNIVLIRKEGFCLNNALSIVIAGFYILGTVAVRLVSTILEKKVFLPDSIGNSPEFLLTRTVITLFLLLMLCYFECILAGTAIMGWKAAKRIPAPDKDFIIILGCSIDKRGGLLPLLKGRVNRAIRFAWDQEIRTGKALRYVPSGGQGPNEIMSEGSAMAMYLLVKGAEDYEVIPEKASANTYENMVFSKKLIDELKPDAKVAFATTNYHILRSGILARRAGLDAEGIAGDTKWYFWPNGFIREFFAILSLNKKAHIKAAAAVALLCVLVGFVGYFANVL